jgi:ATP10 protein
MKKNACFALFLTLILSISGESCKGQTAKTTVKMDNSMASKSERDALIGKVFPELKAQTLSKKDVVFPKDVAGKPTIICIAFVGNAQSLVDTWTTPILKKYPNQEVNFYEIPMIKGAWGIVSGMIDGGMRSGVPKELHGNVATYYGSLTDYKTNLMMPDKNSCYLFLLDKTGVIQYVAEAAADSDKLTVLYGIVDKLNGL